MAANFKLEDILSKSISPKDVKDHIKAKGKLVNSKEEGSFLFLAITNYKFSDAEEGLLLYIDKAGLVDKAFKALKKESAYVKNLLVGIIEANDVDNSILEFTKSQGKGKGSLVAKQMKKNAWIKQAAYACNMILDEEDESEETSDSETSEIPVDSTVDVSAKSSTASVNKEELNAAATLLKDKWDGLSTAYTELQKDKSNKGLLMRVKSLIQDFLTSYEVAPALIKPSVAKIYSNVQTMATNLNISTNSSAATQATVTPEKTKAIEVNTKIKTALDTLLKDINLEAIYNEAVA